MLLVHLTNGDTERIVLPDEKEYMLLTLFLQGNYGALYLLRVDGKRVRIAAENINNMQIVNTPPNQKLTQDRNNWTKRIRRK